MKGLNAKQQQFCRNLANGMTQYEAYLAAGYAKTASRQCASALIRMDKVREYYEELMAEKVYVNEQANAKAIENLAITKERVIAEMATIAFAEVNVKDGVDIKEKSAALMNIAKLFGWIIEKREQKNVSDLEKMTDAELDAEIARLDAKRLAAQAGGIGAWGVN